MPIFEYSCKQCDKIYEIMHKHDEELNLVCDDCLKPIKKQISLGGFRLKGDGWTSKIKGEL